MTWFWIIGAALAALAMFVVLRPLLSRREERGIARHDANAAVYRDQARELDADLAAGTLAQADHASSRRELEARLLGDISSTEISVPGKSRTSAIVTGLAIPFCAAAIYFAVGSPSALLSPTEHIEAMVTRLAARLRENPNDAQLLADFADVLGMARGQSLRGEPEMLVQRALQIDPANLKALALAGTAAFDRRDFAAAAAYWQRMLPLVAADSEDARVIKENVGEALKLAAAGGRSLRGKLEISQELKDQLRPDDTVFLFARAEKGPPMPLAAVKLSGRDLPLEFSLDDSMAMAPELSLSKFPRVVVVARVSRSGRPAAQAGDLQGVSRPSANNAQGVRVVIDTVVP